MSKPSTRIVGIHGFLGRPSDWDKIRESIQKQVPDVLFQTVDVFANLRASSVKTMSAWAKAFNREQKNSHLERNILLGYSMGGRLALQAAMDKPGLWDEIILVSSHPGLISDEEKSHRLKSDLEWSQKFSQLSWSEVVRLWNEQSVFTQSHEPARLEEEFDRKALASTVVNWSLANQNFLGDELMQLKSKLHWYAGGNDAKYIELFHSLKQRGYLAEFGTVEGSGHRVIFDKPVELAHQLVQDLNL